MKKDARSGEQQVESFALNLASTLSAMAIHGSQPTPGAPMERP
jgi:hypothetical protein